MDALVRCDTDAAVTTVRMDDGKRNVLSVRMLRELGSALDRAEARGAPVVLTGRQDVLSAGFDLGVLPHRWCSRADKTC